MENIKPIERRFIDKRNNSIEIDTFRLKKLERKVDKIYIDIRNKRYRIKSRRR